jgi:hypothetical protein
MNLLEDQRQCQKDERGAYLSNLLHICNHLIVTFGLLAEPREEGLAMRILATTSGRRFGRVGLALMYLSRYIVTNMLANCSVEIAGRWRGIRTRLIRVVGDGGETKLGPQSDADAMEGKPTSVVIVTVVQGLLGVVCNGRRGKKSDR